MRDPDSSPAGGATLPPTPSLPHHGGPAVVVGPDLVRVTAPSGWGSREAMTALRPDLVRALAPPLPPADTWPEHWHDALNERAAIAAEGGAADPEAVALADLRVMLWREQVERAERGEHLEPAEAPRNAIACAREASTAARPGIARAS